MVVQAKNLSDLFGSFMAQNGLRTHEKGATRSPWKKIESRTCRISNSDAELKESATLLVCLSSFASCIQLSEYFAPHKLTSLVCKSLVNRKASLFSPKRVFQKRAFQGGFWCLKSLSDHSYRLRRIWMKASNGTLCLQTRFITWGSECHHQLWVKSVFATQECFDEQSVWSSNTQSFSNSRRRVA